MHPGHIAQDAIYKMVISNNFPFLLLNTPLTLRNWVK